MTTSIRGAVNLIPEAPVTRMVELAQHAEHVGYDRCWVYDEGLAARDVYVTLTAIAAGTKQLKLGTGITNPYTRHMSSTVGAIAALDEFSSGRAFLGIGAGGSMTLDPIGITRSRPVVAVGDLVGAARALFSTNRVDYDGEFVSIHGTQLAYARPTTEIWLAGRGPLMLKLGAQRCDGVMLDVIYKPLLGQTIDRIRNLGAEAGNEPKISYSTLLVTDDTSMQVAKNHMTYRLVDSPATVKEAIGLGEDDVAAIRSRMPDGLEAAGELVREEWVLPFVLSGTIAECATELHMFAEQHHFEEFLVPILDEANATYTMDTAAQVIGL